MPKPDGICNPVRNVLCHIGCRDFAQNVSGGVTNPAALRYWTEVFERHVNLQCAVAGCEVGLIFHIWPSLLLIQVQLGRGSSILNVAEHRAECRYDQCEKGNDGAIELHWY